MTDRELMQMALDALENSSPKTVLIEKAIAQGGDSVEIIRSILKRHTDITEAIRAALAQPEQEPWGYISHRSWKMPVFVEAENLEVSGLPFNNPNYTPVYKAPPQREIKPMIHTVHCECGAVYKVDEQPYKQTKPPKKKEWQGLTEYEVGFLTVFDGLHDVEVPLLANFIRHIEAKLKEKNT